MKLQKIAFLVLALSLPALFFSACGSSPEESAKKTYTDFHAAILKGDFDKAKSFCTKENLAEMEKAKKMMPNMKIEEMMKDMMPKNFEISEAKADGELVTLTVKDKDNDKASGAIKMKKEDGKWKVEKVDWNMGTFDIK